MNACGWCCCDIGEHGACPCCGRKAVDGWEPLSVRAVVRQQTFASPGLPLLRESLGSSCVEASLLRPAAVGLSCSHSTMAPP